VTAAMEGNTGNVWLKHVNFLLGSVFVNFQCLRNKAGRYFVYIYEWFPNSCAKNRSIFM